MWRIFFGFFPLKCPRCGKREWLTWGAQCGEDGCYGDFVEMQPNRLTYFLGWSGILMPRDVFQAKKDWWKHD